MSTIEDIPLEVFLDNLLFRLPIANLLRLSSTNKFFYQLCSDETLWKRLLQSDFNFSGAGTARTSGWKFIYQRLFKPRVYVWGEKSNGRLGLSRLPKTTIPDVPFPTQLKFPPRVSIVSLAAAGMSFHALDSHGSVYVWGTLDGQTYALRSDGFSEAGKKASTPVKLQLPAPTKSISCGRLHSSTLDSQNNVWTFVNWGRPFRLPRIHGSTPIQVECGWTYSSLLTNHGEVYVWWPFSGTMKGQIDKHMTDETGNSNRVQEMDGSVPCDTWEIDAQPVLLPSLPALPDLINSNNLGDDQGQDHTRLVQIAGLDGFLIGLTNKGHVLKFRTLEDETTAARGTWEYLPSFSELESVKSHPTFSEEDISAPESLTITHVSAHFDKFTAYSTGSSSVVLIGNTDTDAVHNPEPQILPVLQHKSIISVELGDYHNVALTSDGKLFSWGAYSKGALGLGDPAQLPVGSPGGFATIEDRERAQSRRRGTPPVVETPTEVRFDHGHNRKKDRFCIAATAAGWHTGALVIDLEAEEDGDKTDDEFYQDTGGSDDDALLGIRDPGIPIIPRIGGHQHFRIGFAGRGRGRGNMRGQRG